MFGKASVNLASSMIIAKDANCVQVKHIQEEYQKYMENVRGRAQSAIDQANSIFQGRRSEYAGLVDNLVHQMQSRFLALQVGTAWLVKGVDNHHAPINPER